MSKGERFKWEILKHAVELFEEHGYVDTTTRMIAERAEVGRGHLYYYFKKKEDMMRELTHIFFRKIVYFIREEMDIQIDEPFLYFSFMIRCHTHFVMKGDYFKSMFDEQKVFDLSHVMGCESYFEEIEKLALKQGLNWNDIELKNSIEIGLLIFNHYMTKKLNGYDIETDEIPDMVLKHALLDFEYTAEEVENINQQSRVYFDQMDFEALSVLVYRSDYEEIIKFI